MQPRTTPPSLEPIFLFMKPNENSKQAVRSAAARSAHARARRARMLEYRDVDNAEAAGSQDASVDPSQVAISSGRQVAHRASTDLTGPILGYGRRDPFASLAIQCTPFENLLLDHYVNIVIPYSTTYYTPSTYRSPAEYTSNMNEHWIRFALTEPGMMNGIFLMSCRSLANLYNQKEYNVSALKYKQKCIEMVRHDIDRNQSISDLTIAKVLFLVSDEFHTGNIEGTRSHTEAIGKLVQMRGGLKALGLEGTLQDLVLWNDRMSTFYTGTRPNFMHAETFVDSATAKYLTPGFYHAATEGLFSKDMIQILDDICGATLLTQKVETTSTGPELQLDFSSRLLVLSSDHRCPASSRNYSLFEQCLCLALMVFVKLALRSQTSGASYGPLLGSSYLAMRIQQFLEGLVATGMEEAETGGRHAELLLWMAAMGAWADSQTPLAASERDEDQQEGQTLVLGSSLWRELVRDLDINTLDDFRVHMLSFLWLDESFGSFATNLWESRSVIEIQES